ncbi:MAG: hypothetical protein L0Z55_07710 [Planctomycetes bacterium]|nr:hypothetical protein [Planctomycetota bacterium]
MQEPTTATPGLLTTVDLLRTEEKRIFEALAPLVRQADEIAKQLLRVQVAIAELTGETPQRMAAPRPSGGGASVDEVAGLIERVLQSRGPLEYRKLMEIVSRAAERGGRSKKGLGLVVRNALRRAQFQNGDGTYQLATNGHQ